MATFILCTGMRRSASTLQYNIVKRILEISEKGVALGYAESPEIENLIEQNKDKEEYFVIKVHDYFPLAGDLVESGDAKIVFSIRDIRDVIVSSMHKWHNGSFRNTYNETYLNMLRQSYDEWMGLSNIYFSKYEEIINDIQIEVNNIAAFIKIDLPKQKIKEIAQELTIENQLKKINNMDFNITGIVTSSGIRDKETQLHSNHIRSGKENQWKTELKPYQIGLIQYDWKNWLNENGYRLFPTIYNNYFILHFRLFLMKRMPKFSKFIVLINRSLRRKNNI